MSPGILRGRLPAEEHVLRDGEFGHEAELLVDQSDAELARAPRRLDPLRRAVDEDVAGIVGIAAGEHPHESGLAGSVLADDGVNLARAYVQVDPANRMGSKKALADLDHPDRRPAPAGRSAQGWDGGCETLRISL